MPDGAFSPFAVQGWMALPPKEDGEGCIERRWSIGA